MTFQVGQSVIGTLDTIDSEEDVSLRAILLELAQIKWKEERGGE